jgi:hypothetical protein
MIQGIRLGEKEIQEEEGGRPDVPVRLNRVIPISARKLARLTLSALDSVLREDDITN